MKIIKESINDIGVHGDAIEKLSMHLSTQSCVSLDVRCFDYVVNPVGLVEFTLEDFKNLYPEFTESDYLKKKSYFYIEGPLVAVSFEESRSIIDLHIFCGGIEMRPVSKEDVCPHLKDSADESIRAFWVEVEKNFRLPPTRVYQHYPRGVSAAFSGVFWEFCFIYLDDRVGRGVVLSASAHD
jgi:hypothetical protein